MARMRIHAAFCGLFATLFAGGVLPFAKGFASPLATVPAELMVEHVPMVTAGLSEGIIANDALSLTGAWELRTQGGELGGISGMILHENALLLLSDRGSLIRLGLPSLASAQRADVQSLPEHCLPGETKADRDGESIAANPMGTGVRIGIERSNRICAFVPGNSKGGQLVSLPAMSAWPHNKGAEAIASLPGKGMAIIGEASMGASQERPLLWYHGDPAQQGSALVRMRYVPPEGYKPGDAAFLPDGRLLVLNRKSSLINGYATILTISDAFDPVEGGVITGSELARIKNVTLAGNYEGMALRPGPSATTIWLISDDNFSARKNTMLLQFELSHAGGAPSAIR